MSGREELELSEELKKYKGLADAHVNVSCPSLSGTYLGDCLLSEPELASELFHVNVALCCLQSRIGEARLRPILSKLFDNRSLHKATKAWDQALSEIFAFAHFESLGILHSIGWPSTFPSDDAPFDFAIRVGGNIVAGDVKPANGSGYRLLEETIRKCVAEHSAKVGEVAPPITVRFHGPLTQEVVGEKLREFAQSFSKKLSEQTMSEPKTLTSMIGGTRLTVFLGDTEQLGGGITGTSSLSDALAPTIREHITGKGRHGRTYNVPYFLAYVRLPGRGAADFKTHATFGDSLGKAIKLIEPPLSDWLGALFLSPATPNTEPRFFESSNADWPAELSGKTLSQCLYATLTPVPHLLEDIHEGKTRFKLPYGPRVRVLMMNEPKFLEMPLATQYRLQHQRLKRDEGDEPFVLEHCTVASPVS